MIRRIYPLALVGMGVALVVLTFGRFEVELAPYREQFHLGAALLIILLAFFCEYFDTSLGMGYGTTLTPVLIILGFSPLDVVPAILLSEMISGFAAAYAHQEFGNVNFKKGSRALNVMLVLAVCSIIGTVGAVFLAVNIPKETLTTAIGVMVLLTGLFLLIRRNAEVPFSWRRITSLGLIASFNKGLSGGGYGPLVTGGQILSGMPEKNAVAVTSFAEALVCLVGLTVYIILCGTPLWTLTIPLCIGAFISVPLSAYTVKVLPTKFLRGAIGYVTVFLGCIMLAKVLIGS